MVLRLPRNRPARSGPQREPYDRVLIVCEGKRTEPLYFGEIASRYRLSTANIKVVGSGADPRTVVQEAKKERDRERRHGEKYDRVYCVFDRDEHATFHDACNEAGPNRLMVAASWPCFEYWLRLHCGFSRQPYASSGGRSPAQNCLHELCKLLPGYAKAARGVFLMVENRLEEAKVHAARALADAEATGEFNPSTRVHELVEYLQSLKPDEAENCD